MIGATAINNVILMGRLTADPELKTTSGGLANVQFTIAVTRAFKNQSGEYESDFIRCVAWRTTAEFICRNFAKGQLILVEGNLRTGSYDDKNHPDVKHYTTDVYVDNVGFGQTKSQGDTSAQPTQQAAPAAKPKIKPDYYLRPQANKQQAQQQVQTEPAYNMADFEEVISDNEGLPF